MSRRSLNRLRHHRDLVIVVVEIIGDPDAAFPAAQLPRFALLAKRPKASDGLAGARDDDLLSRLGALDETRQMRLRLVDVDWDGHV